MSTAGRICRGALAGVAAGAAGTTALNAVTYLDMAIRGRPSSSTPQKTVTTLADKAGIEIPGDEETRGNRVAGLGPLTGLFTGLGVGAVMGAARGAGWRPPWVLGTVLTGGAAMAASDVPMAALGVTDPTTWKPTEWLADMVPHVAYGAATAAVLAALHPTHTH